MNVRLVCLTPGGIGGALPDANRIKKFEAALADSFRRVANGWRDESKRNAPIGPSKGDLRKLQKGGGTFTTKGTSAKPPQTIKLTRFYRASAAALASKTRGTVAGPAGGLGERLTSWKQPGGLENSIKCEYDAEHAEVFVASNATAGQYAGIIHDMKGVKWHERGPGTQSKGERADEKFIERALPDAEAKLRDALGKSLKELFGS